MKSKQCPVFIKTKRNREGRRDCHKIKERMDQEKPREKGRLTQECRGGDGQGTGMRDAETPVYHVQKQGCVCSIPLKQAVKIKSQNAASRSQMCPSVSLKTVV